ncbi:hypothetical protein C922_05291 [Plasmodium inui San Antonio 1]|uniref:Uncharacterized protein n=1 Tax=Plasmodium inui San Antonio 1 TaxID=1237626 RepID=W6ZTT3_9APIC|nr:hypothetical protein C922_05291 [Plasmodium inui San Antonio 1]EUD64332.1 hypothetical protein C922_05291 [Plasmodium inui San Antonio 1]
MEEKNGQEKRKSGLTQKQEIKDAFLENKSHSRNNPTLNSTETTGRISTPGGARKAAPEDVSNKTSGRKEAVSLRMFRGSFSRTPKPKTDSSNRRSKSTKSTTTNGGKNPHPGPQRPLTDKTGDKREDYQHGQITTRARRGKENRKLQVIPPNNTAESRNNVVNGGQNRPDKLQQRGYDERKETESSGRGKITKRFDATEKGEAEKQKGKEAEGGNRNPKHETSDVDEGPNSAGPIKAKALEGNCREGTGQRNRKREETGAGDHGKRILENRRKEAQAGVLEQIENTEKRSSGQRKRTPGTPKQNTRYPKVK